MVSISFDPSKHRLGRLCKRGHAHDDTGKTVRYQANGSCVACSQLSSAKYHEDHKDEIHARAKAWRGQNEDQLREKMQAYEQSYGRTKRGQEVRQRARQKRVTEGRDKISRDKYRRTPKGKESQRKSNTRWRMRKLEQAGVVTQQYKDALLEALAFRCPVCRVSFHLGPERIPEQLTWDHIIPLSEGGRDKDGNLLPLCRGCNCSKGEKTFEQWLQRPVNCIADLRKSARGSQSCQGGG